MNVLLSGSWIAVTYTCLVKDLGSPVDLAQLEPFLANRHLAVHLGENSVRLG
jgi:hypothetical protein